MLFQHGAVQWSFLSFFQLKAFEILPDKNPNPKNKWQKSQHFHLKWMPLVGDHSSITSAKRWVGGVRKWQFLLIYSTIYADVGGCRVGLKYADVILKWSLVDLPDNQHSQSDLNLFNLIVLISWWIKNSFHHFYIFNFPGISPFISGENRWDLFKAKLF